MLLEDINGKKSTDKVKVSCDNCNHKWEKRLNTLRSSRRKRGEDKDYCRSCSASISSSKKPQCSSEYWTEARKEQHSDSIKTEKYYDGIKNRPDIHGENNPMYGKRHSDISRRKMSISRTGKTGENATAWKGGQLSLTKRLKKYQYRRGWQKIALERDNYKCTKCSKTKNEIKLDVHHIEPMVSLIERLINDSTLTFNNDEQRYKYLIQQPEIKDEECKNGLTLCRTCHKEIHLNWGSHKPKTNG